MASTDKRRNLRAWRNKRGVAKKKATALFNQGEVITCWLCKQPIDMTLPYHDKAAWTLDHVEPIATDGHILGTTLDAHRSCNSSKGARVNPLQGQTRAW